ncbi:MAG TPA: alpha/beta fold hydrolase [Thermomicrobiales bacterium]|nr:alpha/beta fold hydrolase [Thermomicrobiales bacterium]
MIDAHIQTIQLDDMTVAYERLGNPSPDPVIFLHGLGDSAIITFRSFAVSLARSGISSVLIDLPGFGFSQAPAHWSAATEDQAIVVAALLDHLNITHSPIVAHSMGGSIAILLAEIRPDLVSRLIVAEPLLLPEQSTLGKSVAKRTEAWFVDRGYAMLRLATQRQAARGDLAAIGFVEPLARANPAIMHRSASSLLVGRSPSFQDRLTALTLPRTLLIGERTIAETEQLEDAGVAVQRIPDAGHSMMSENPAAFDEAIRNALGH